MNNWFVMKVMFKFVQKKNERPDYIVGRDWAELKKTWDKYKAAADEQNSDKINRFANKINHLQEKLCIKKTDFSKHL